jgi:serine/threonine-protein kinase
MKSKEFACIATIILLAAAAARADDYRTYSNDRFGATADVPASWQADPPPENGDGLRFRSPDGKASIIVSGILNVDDDLEEALTGEEQPSEGDTVTYRHRSGKTVTISGMHGDLIYYRKSTLVCGDQIWNSVYLEYPAAEKSKYNDLVARVARSLHFSGSSGQVPDCH